MPKTKAKKTESKTQYKHRSVTELKAGHDPLPTTNGSWDAQYQTCETCGRQIIEVSTD